MGLFFPFVGGAGVRKIGVEAAGHGLESGLHSATITAGSVGVLHGSKTYLLQDADGQVQGAHSVAAGLDYPGVGPEHSYFQDAGEVEYVSVTDEEAISAFSFLSEVEGIIPALETAHAVAHVRKIASSMSPEQVIVICLSGRGDKDIHTASSFM